MHIFAIDLYDFPPARQRRFRQRLVDGSRAPRPESNDRKGGRTQMGDGTVEQSGRTTHHTAATPPPPATNPGRVVYQPAGPTSASSDTGTPSNRTSTVSAAAIAAVAHVSGSGTSPG
jgi:hypothetical protein